MLPNEARLLRALAREGLSVTHDGPVYTVRLTAEPGSPAAEILLPAELPLESKAVKQLAELAAVRDPHGRGHVCRVCATPDFHPGDSGVTIGSVVETDGLLIPAGTDINCGMRLHVVDMPLERFLSRKASFVEKMKGDYLLGTRDVGMTADAMGQMFEYGLPAWAARMQDEPLGRMKLADWKQVSQETLGNDLHNDDGQTFSRVYSEGSMVGSCGWAPPGLVPEDGSNVRDDGLATIGKGNHFVEVQVDDLVHEGLQHVAEVWTLFGQPLDGLPKAPLRPAATRNARHKRHQVDNQVGSIGDELQKPGANAHPLIIARMSARNSGISDAMRIRALRSSEEEAAFAAGAGSSILGLPP